MIMMLKDLNGEGDYYWNNPIMLYCWYIPSPCFCVEFGGFVSFEEFLVFHRTELFKVLLEKF